MTHPHINVITKEGTLEQIHSVEGVTRFRPTKAMLDAARKLVEERFPGYKSATLVLAHYDKDRYNDKCNYKTL